MNFHRFYDTWSDQLRQLLHQLSQVPSPPTTDEHRHQLQQLVQESMSHYDEYYRAKSTATKQDVMAFFSAASWTTALERSLQWIGGWRPTTAYHLIYTECSILFETNVLRLLQGLSTGDLGDLSSAQFSRVSEMQIETVQKENHLMEELCDWQDDASYLVDTAHGNSRRNMDKLAEILERADQLRLSTIRSLVELLSPQQAAQFLVAAAELYFGIRGWGIQQDIRRASS
ncbi:transcription factor tga3 [Phtheirospermum japonicum]|uniref:Transcription factor tga3 n=1 Tax=Phtheirospermum japonicum TaxID=374723 RepID=A0A830AXX1_9LAMI|nr:transcription factor tga3 [Phtheirospermum japonicum]